MWGGADYKVDFAKDGKIFIDGELKELIELKDFLQSGAADYFVFTDGEGARNFKSQAGKLKVTFPDKIFGLEKFKTLPLNFFYDIDSERKVIFHMNTLKIKTLLDVDGYFSYGELFTKLDNEVTQIDFVGEKDLPPIMENIYRRAYKNFAEVGFKNYEAILLAEREPAAFEDMLILTENFSDMVITFARKGSALEKHLATKNFFKKATVGTGTGTWYFLTRHNPAKDFAVYVVTHKKVELDGLPDGYKIIHAGREGKDDLGYIGDDTGDNISRLNPYINELTALYWVWKNTAHDIVGFCHYRRFFTEARNKNFSFDKILTKDAAEKILTHYDIIALASDNSPTLTKAIVRNVRSAVHTETAVKILKKHLKINHPDYLDAFDKVFDGTHYYNKNMYLTRGYIFDAYGKWLFPFFIDATEEFLKTVPKSAIKGSCKRMMGYFAEHMHTVWLIKNRLRIWEMGIMENK